jgi:hypothetical protein
LDGLALASEAPDGAVIGDRAFRLPALDITSAKTKRSQRVSIPDKVGSDVLNGSRGVAHDLCLRFYDEGAF